MGVKTCIRCHLDCSDRPRVRDRQGRYVCRACLSPAELVGSLEQPARSPVGVAASPGQDQGAIPIVEDDPRAGLPHLAVCPACQSSLSHGATICIQCGFDAATGQRMSTNLGDDADLPDHRPARATCPTCGYSMKGLKKPRCPECGTVVLAPDLKERLRETSRQTLRGAYLKPVVYCGIGAVMALAYFAATGQMDELPNYAITLAIAIPIGAVAYLLCCLFHLGFDGPLHLTLLRLCGVYAVTGGAWLLMRHVPFFYFSLMGPLIVYALLLSDMFDLDFEDAAIVGVVTFAIVLFGSMAIFAWVWGMS